MGKAFFEYPTPLEAAKAAAEEAESFRVRDYDRRYSPAEGTVQGPFGEMTFLDPHAGTRLWIYLAVLPLDYRSDGIGDADHAQDVRTLRLSRSRLAWCASAAYPAGELGMVGAEPGPDEWMIDRETYEMAAEAGWPPMTGGQG